MGAAQADEGTPLAGWDDYTWFAQPALSPTSDAVALIGSSARIPPRLLLGNAAAPRPRIVRRTTSERIAPEHLASAQQVSWQAEDGSRVYGLLSLPAGFSAGDAGAPLPPAIVKVHGGPTAQTVASYAAEVQFFTTLGYVVLEVNYRGSSGYGRSYRDALHGAWGVRDVEDTVSGARYLVAQGLADERALVVMGSSAGGYTVLETLCRAPGVFKAGICLYGISDLLAVAVDTHKFEEHYLDSLLGPLPAASNLYRERSPLLHAHLLNDALVLFQGSDDRVVPRAQADRLVESLRRRGVPHEYHLYEGEGHGWRTPATVEQYYTAVEQFLRTYVVFA